MICASISETLHFSMNSLPKTNRGNFVLFQVRKTELDPCIFSEVGSGRYFVLRYFEHLLAFEHSKLFFSRFKTKYERVRIWWSKEKLWELVSCEVSDIFCSFSCSLLQKKVLHQSRSRFSWGLKLIKYRVLFIKENMKLGSRVYIHFKWQRNHNKLQILKSTRKIVLSLIVINSFCHYYNLTAWPTCIIHLSPIFLALYSLILLHMVKIVSYHFV